MPTEHDQPVYSILGGNPAYSPLVAAFVAEMPARIQAVVALHQAADYDGLQGIAHQLKGTAGSYGFPDLTQIAGRVEAAAAMRAPLPELRAQVDLLAALAGRLRAGKPQ